MPRFNIKKILTDPVIICGFLAGFLCMAVGIGVGGVIFQHEPEAPGTVIQEVEVPAETEPAVELAEEQVPALVEDADGNLEEVNLPTVEEVDGGKIDDSENFARGAYYDTSSSNAFAEATLGKCVVEGNFYGAQCVSLARAFWSSYAGRSFSTCGTGAAKGAFNCTVENAGDEFATITNPDELQAGDWIILSGGLYGHVGMAMGPMSNGYIALLGENQGGKTCDEGGSATNIVNISLKNFIGAYRPKIYITYEPADALPNTSAGGLK